MAIGIASYQGIGYYKTIDLDAPIYRFIPLSRLLEALEKNELYLRNTLFWDDNWEIPTRYFNTIGLPEQEALFFKKETYYQTYAICFTKNYDNDAMWRIYSRYKESVCIETTPRLLLHELHQHKDYLRAYFAPVIYVDISNEKPESIFNKEFSDRYPASFYVSFLKRNAFAHENEMRLGIQSIMTKRDTDSSNSGLKITYDSRKIISRILLDPRLSSQEVNYHKNGLNFLGVPVEQSSLFTTGSFEATDYVDLIQNVCNCSVGGSMFGSYSLELDKEDS